MSRPAVEQNSVRDHRAPLAVSFGAVAGALSRFYIGVWLAPYSGSFPYSTFLINITGCFGMGCFVTLALRQGRITFHPDLVLLVTTGFLGSYTTFSTYELETAHLLETKGWFTTTIYGLGSVTLGIAALRLGEFLARISTKIGDS